MSTLKRKLLRSGCGIGLFAAPVVALAQVTPAAETPVAGTPSSEVVTLEEFIVRESEAQSLNSLMPTDIPVGGAFLGNVNVLDLPRSATILSPESMKQLAVDGFEDFDRVGAGLSRPNIFGIPGLPFIRGDNASVLYNGMLRIPNQNETPTSFGSFESVEIIKGPAPAQFGPTNAGGYVQAIPKTPYFDKQRGSVEFTYGEYDKYKVQADVGGPFELLGKPMAYRVSVTQQQSESYYDNVKNDYASVYAALKGQITPKLTFFTGGEYYDFKSNENAGWNRVTQNLIDNSNYIIGTTNPNFIATTGPYSGFANPYFSQDQTAAAFGPNIPVPITPPPGPQVPPGPNGVNNSNFQQTALVVKAADFQRFYGAPTGGGGAYLAGPASFTTPIFLGGNLFGYQYTPAYFANGGTALTEKISGNTVLSDRNDQANSQTGIWFGDLEWAGDNRKIALKKFVESIETEKVSSYGYARGSESYALATKLIIEESHDFGSISAAFQYGVDFRRTQVNDAQDFNFEPFNKRDITEPITPESIILSGPPVNWAFLRGEKSEADQYGIFLQNKIDFTDSFMVFAGIRHEFTRFSVRDPDEGRTRGPTFNPTPTSANHNPALPVGTFTGIALRPARMTGGDENYWSFSINPIYKVTDWWSVYAALQEATALVPAQTGGVLGTRNFADSPFQEVGTKFSVLDKKLFLTASLYRFEKSSFGVTPFGQAEDTKYRSEGYEFEAVYKPINRFTILGSFGQQESKYLGGIPFATRPLTDEQVALTGNAIQYGPFGGLPATRFANNLDAVRQGYPQFTANLFAVYEFENGFGIGAGPQYKSDFYNNNEKTIKLPEALVWNVNLFYRTEKWEVFARLNNVTDEDFFIGSTFAPTMIVTKAEPFNWEVAVKYKF